MANIDYNIRGLLFPWSYGAQHLAVACTETTWEGRAVHLIIGLAEWFLPGVNYVVAIFDRIMNGSSRVTSPPASLEGRVSLGGCSPAEKGLERQAQTTVPGISPTPIIGDYYRKAKTCEERGACLEYLLHYQHYNADWTAVERGRFSYPSPLCAESNIATYVRADFTCLFNVIKPWIQKRLVPFLKALTPFEGDGLKYIKLASSSTLPVLEMFFSQGCLLVDNVNSLQKDRKKKQVLIVRLTPDDLKRSWEEILTSKEIQKEKLRKTHSNLRFLFLLERAGIDCILVWGGQWGRSLEKVEIQFSGLNNRELFGKEVFSCLNKMGAVSDRLAVNTFLSKALAEEEYATALGDLGLSVEEISPQSSEESAWEELMQQIGRFPFVDDPGSRRYRDAILRWHARFFKAKNLVPFAASLLHSQVRPYMSEEGGITQWSKAYQNLAEIVMFCLQAHPHLCSQIDLAAILKARSIGLFPYAMTAVFHILNHVLTRPEWKGKKITTASISQSYFETLFLLESMEKKGRTSFERKETLDALEHIPDILIADIHPNNAAQPVLFQNDVAGWVAGKLTAEPARKMILLLDLTLNHFSDPIVQQTLSKLDPFIQKGRLEIFTVQSLAKLAQMGADNFSGGMAIYFGGEERNAFCFPSIPPEKAAFFGYLLRDFSDLTKAYVDHVRENTDGMYQTLSAWLQRIAKEDQLHYCAAEVTLNGDENTVYVGIGFKPLFQLLKLAPSDEAAHIEKEKEEKRKEIASSIRQTLLEWAAKRGLPITGRQSFGFSLSNMSGVCGDTIRFSIGVESREILAKYAEHIADVCYVLSKDSSDGDRSKFKERVDEIFCLATGEKNLDPCEVSLQEKGFDEYGDDTFEKIGRASINSKGGQLSLQICRPGEKPFTVAQSDIGIYTDLGTSHPHAWTFSKRVKLFYQILQNPGFLSVILERDTYSIGGVHRDYLRFREGGKIENPYGITVDFDPFRVTLADGREFNREYTYVILERLGPVPVKMSRLPDADLKEVFQKLALHDFTVVRHPDKQGAILIQFGQKKELWDYHDQLVALYNTQGGLPAVVAFLNSLNMDTLPLPHTHSWNHSPAPLEHLKSTLGKLGAHLVYDLDKVILEKVLQISHKECRTAVFEGMLEGLFEGSKEKMPLNPEVAQCIAETFAREDSPIPIDGYRFIEWIRTIDKQLKRNPEDNAWLIPYFTALFPALETTYSSPGDLFDMPHDSGPPHSIIAHRVAENAGALRWRSHMVGLEDKLPAYAGKTSAKFLDLWLHLYVNRPLPPRLKQAILQRLIELPEALKSEWIDHELCYNPLDHVNIHLIGPENFVIFYEEDRDLIQEFFRIMGCQEILLKRLEQERGALLPTALRWAIITKDPELLRALLPICQAGSFASEVREKLEFYLPHLEDAIPL